LEPLAVTRVVEPPIPQQYEDDNVQSDHYEKFFSPKMDKHDYYGVYNDSNNKIDGCATFFRRDRFSHVKKYEVAQSLTDAMIPTTQKKTALNRLVKDNVALIVVLEAKVNNQPIDNPGKRQLLCVLCFSIFDLFMFLDCLYNTLDSSTS
ncbi:Carbon catabolite repressor protein 4 1, partial [Stylosanthes scabra]|nr:Carbon catabolite repressor protein 4 1 [Stylosanthes scabra]